MRNRLQIGPVEPAFSGLPAAGRRLPIRTKALLRTPGGRACAPRANSRRRAGEGRARQAAGKDLREQAQLVRQLHRPAAVRIDEHGPQLLRDPLRSPREFRRPARGRPRPWPGSRRSRAWPRSGRPATCALFFGHPVGGIADRANDAGRQVPLPADVIVGFVRDRVVEHAVDREIAAQRVVFRRAKDNVLRSPAVDVRPSVRKVATSTLPAFFGPRTTITPKLAPTASVRRRPNSSRTVSGRASVATS